MTRTYINKLGFKMCKVVQKNERHTCTFFNRMKPSIFTAQVTKSKDAFRNIEVISDVLSTEVYYIVLIVAAFVHKLSKCI